MAGHVVTNRGLYTLLSTAFTGSTDLRQLAFTNSGTPPTDAQLYDVNTVSDLLGLVTEATVAGYSRADLTGLTVTEDDTNNLVTITADAYELSTVAVGETWAGVAYYIQNTSDATRLVISVDRPATAIPTNGSNIVLPQFSMNVQRA